MLKKLISEAFFKFFFVPCPMEGPIKSLFFLCLSICLPVCLSVRQSCLVFFSGTLVFFWVIAQSDCDQPDCRFPQSPIQYPQNELMHAVDYFYVDKHRSNKLIHKYQLGKVWYDLVSPKYVKMINQQYLNNKLKYQIHFLYMNWYPMDSIEATN